MVTSLNLAYIGFGQVSFCPHWLSPCRLRGNWQENFKAVYRCKEGNVLSLATLTMFFWGLQLLSCFGTVCLVWHCEAMNNQQHQSFSSEAESVTDAETDVLQTCRESLLSHTCIWGSSWQLGKALCWDMIEMLEQSLDLQQFASRKINSGFKWTDLPLLKC